MKECLRAIYDKVPLKQAVFTAIRTFYRPPESVFKHLHFKGIIRVPVGGSSFRLRHEGAKIENSIFWAGLENSWEGKSMALWARLCRKSKCIVDVGANTGVYSLVAKAVSPQAHVIAFEPVPQVFSKLIANCKLNGYDVRTIEAALSNFDGDAKVFDLLGDQLVYSVTVNRNLNAPGVPVVEVPVRARRLDSFLKSENVTQRVDLMKIDVETHEPEVLEGMGAILERDRPAMLIEILNDEVAMRVEKLVAGLSYRFFNICETDGPREQEHLTKSLRYNFLLCDDVFARELGLDKSVRVAPPT